MRGFWVREVDRARLLTPYSAAFVDALKTAVPFRYLRWDQDTKSWVVRQPYIEDALRIAHDHYDEMVALEQAAGGVRSSSAPPPRPAHNAQQCLSEVRRIWGEEAALGLLPDAPPSVVHAVYRALALLVHPDRGGSHERMVEVNRAYELLKKLGKA